MKKIIVAEGSSTIKSVADSLLRQHGYDVVCTSDGLQAWEAVQANRPDLVLAGIGLSGISGLDLCRQMSGDQNAKQIPVVLMISVKDNISEDQLSRIGASERLKKPFSPRDLLEVVKKLIGEGEKVAQASGTTNVTKYKADVLSTTRHLNSSEKEVYNLDWSDLVDTKDIDTSEPEKVATLGQSDNDNDNDNELLINNDQFGLVGADFETDAPVKAPAKEDDDEDYNWFIGEMKREMEGGPRPADKSEKPAESKPSQPEKAPAPPEKELNFEDFGANDGGASVLNLDEPIADEIIDDVTDEVPDQVANTVASQVENLAAEVSGRELSEDEISKIADKVTENLASAISSTLDKDNIIQAIKSILEK